MRSRFTRLFTLLCLFALPVIGHAQSQIRLGNAAVELTGPWKFHTGDNMTWAEQNFDDSAWGTMDLTPPPGSYDPNVGSGGYVPGWTARGYPGYSEYAWYRLRVNIENTTPDSNRALALKMPDGVDDAYQVYVNGQFAGEFGHFSRRGVTIYSTQPRAFPLPADTGNGPLTIAIRMWMDPGTPLIGVDAGGMHGAPVLGQASVIQAMLRLDWDAEDRGFASLLLEMAMLLLAMGVAFALFWLDSSEPAYLWLGLTCAALLIYAILSLIFYYTTWIAAPPEVLLTDVTLVPVTLGLWVLFWAYWFRLDHIAGLHRIVWSLAILLVIGTAMIRAPLYGRVVPVHAIVYLLPITLTLKLLLGLLLVWVTYRGIRRDKAEGWLALPAVVLVVISLYQEELGVLHVPVNFFPFGFGLGLRQIAIILSLIIITVLLVRRFLHSQREHTRIRMELRQARHVQEMLIPAHATQVPGFAIESAYLPAQEVGGDFFQLFPGAADGDGSLLVIVGDVSGKGLEAAMTVSAIVGALRGCSSRAPADVLRYLNRVLYGQVGGFVTCSATMIAPDGTMTIANAGHLSPYRNGKELAVNGDLPLGILAEADYQEMRYQLSPGDRLTFMSDGVVEARNAKGELYGFARTQQISSQPAAEIAEAAKNFGQEDDITVLTIEFAGAAPPAALRGAVLV